MGNTAWWILGGTIYVAASAAVWIVALRAWRRAMRLPALHPAEYLAAGRPRGDGPVVVCAGDSLTHGHVSASFVERLRKRLGPRGHTFVNAGINGELSYNLLQRIGDVVACEPDVVTVLVGTNDATASLMPTKQRKALRQKGLPEAPTPELYRRWLTEIVEQLLTETGARVALLSPPPIGEDLDAPIAVRSSEVAAIAREVAEATGVTYLPLHERIAEVIRAEGGGRSPRPYDERNWLIFRAILGYHLLGRGWDEIARGNGYVLLTDALHLNERGAALVAELIEEFVER